MRTIERTLTRETAVSDKGRPIVVTIHARYMTLRLKGTREAYTLPYDAAFSLAAKQSFAANGGK